jgi:hypothetical protein
LALDFPFQFDAEVRRNPNAEMGEEFAIPWILHGHIRRSLCKNVLLCGTGVQMNQQVIPRIMHSRGTRLKGSVGIAILSFVLALSAVPSIAASSSYSSHNTSNLKCLIQVPNGSVVINDTSVAFPDGIVHIFPADTCVGTMGMPPTINGWLEEAYNNAPGGMNSLTGQWIVGSAPSNQNDPLIYLFNSMQGKGFKGVFYIIQPVLAWGCAAYYLFRCVLGGHNWWIASWYVDANNNAYHSAPVTVSVNDQLTGAMQWQNPSSWSCGRYVNEGYAITFANTTSGGSSNLNYCGIQMSEADAAVLEVYRVDSCNQLPYAGVQVFSNIASSPSFSSWYTQTFSRTPNCNPSPSVISSSTIWLLWSSG